MGIPHPTGKFAESSYMADATALARAAVLRIVLIERRKQAKMTQAQLAKKLGWDQSTVSMMENGQRRIDMIEFMALSDAIGFDPVEVVKQLRVIQAKE
jgi:transcriptional regulator with XRE-family HTH domain